MAKKRVPAAEARAAMKDLVDAVKDRNERIKITRYGKTVAYLVPASDGEALENCQSELEDCLRRRSSAAQGPGTDKPDGTKTKRPSTGGGRKRPLTPR